MTLDEAIVLLKFNNKHIADLKNDDLQQLAEWLEELKFLKQWKSDIMDSFCKYDVNSFEELVTNTRNKAIDDFVKEFKRKTPMENCLIDELAEQLKAGITND